MKDQVKVCGRKVRRMQGPGLRVLADAEKGARNPHWVGYESCNSATICPTCAPKKARQKAYELTTLLTGWSEMTWPEEDGSTSNGQVLFLTLTIGHANRKRFTCSEMIQEVLSLWNRLQKRNSFRVLPIEGWYRAIEVTYSESNGWHAHIHALLFTWTSTLEEFFSGYDAVLRDWDGLAREDGFRTARKAQRIELANLSDFSLAKLGGYLHKEGDWTIADELERWTDKRARDEGVSPMQILTAAAVDGDPVAKSLWHEWERASHRVQMTRWSNLMKLHLTQMLAEVEAEAEKQRAKEAKPRPKPVEMAGIPARLASQIAEDKYLDLLQMRTIADLADPEDIADYLEAFAEEHDIPLLIGEDWHNAKGVRRNMKFYGRRPGNRLPTLTYGH